MINKKTNITLLITLGLTLSLKPMDKPVKDMVLVKKGLDGLGLRISNLEGMLVAEGAKLGCLADDPSLSSIDFSKYDQIKESLKRLRSVRAGVMADIYSICTDDELSMLSGLNYGRNGGAGSATVATAGRVYVSDDSNLSHADSSDLDDPSVANFDLMLTPEERAAEANCS